MKKYKSPWLAENYFLLQILIVEILEMCFGVISFYVTDECFSWFLLFSFQMSAPVTRVSMEGPVWTGSMGLTAPVGKDIPVTSVRSVSGKLCAPLRSVREGCAWTNTPSTRPYVSVVGDIGLVSLHNYLPYNDNKSVTCIYLYSYFID